MLPHDGLSAHGDGIVQQPNPQLPISYKTAEFVAHILNMEVSLPQKRELNQSLKMELERLTAEKERNANTLKNYLNSAHVFNMKIIWLHDQVSRMCTNEMTLTPLQSVEADNNQPSTSNSQ